MCVLRPSAVSNSLRSPGLWPARLLCLWNFSGKNNGAGLEFPPPGDLPHPEIEHASLSSPALAGRFFTISATCLGKKLLHKTPRCLTDPRVREAAFPPPLGKYIVCLCFKQWRSVLGSFWLPGWLSGKESACRTADVGSIPGEGRPPGGGNGNPLQCSCLENPMDRGTWRATVHGLTKESD